MEVVFVSGLSGSGKSVALRMLEDFGYYCVDNLPISLLPLLLDNLKDQEKLAVSIDIRNLNELQLKAILTQFQKYKLIFLDSSKETLIKRYTETRRRHPLNLDKSTDIDSSIQQEREQLSFLRELADFVIDTSNYTPHELANHVKSILTAEEPKKSLKLFFYSFGFKYGNINNLDFVFDLRSLPNPYWKKELRDFTGKDQQVIEYLKASSEVQQYLKLLKDFLTQVIDQINNTNRLALNVGFGCNGGKHRSVFFAEYFAEIFAQEYQVHLQHLTINK